MKHRISQRKLGRTTKHRIAMLKTMVTQLIRHERIETTLPKAKELKKAADKVIRYGKEGSDHSKKLAKEIVRGPEELFKLFTELAHRYRFRAGGYTRVIRSRVRHHDTAQLAYIEFVDRIGELRPARPPISFLPLSAEIMMQSHSTAPGEDVEDDIKHGDAAERSSDAKDVEAGEDEGDDKKGDKPKRFFGLF